MKTKTIAIILTIITILFILTPNANAVLNSNGSTPTTQIINDWMINIRKIESLGGGLGLAETIKLDLTPSTASNNLDIHMEKNTEYGAMAILSASSYGNPNKIASGGTTTGNQTGIVININNNELVAAINGSNSLIDSMKNAASKYKNIYNYHPTYGPRMIGDAITETSGWHGGYASWYNGQTSYGNKYDVVARAKNSIFGYEISTNTGYDKVNPTRAAVVCGEGI